MEIRKPWTVIHESWETIRSTLCTTAYSPESSQAVVQGTQTQQSLADSLS